MTIFYPFNNNPYSTTIKTASDTIPTGYYARVTPIEFYADFTIDAATMVPTKVFLFQNSGTTVLAETVYLTVPAGQIGTFTIFGNGANLVTRVYYGAAAGVETIANDTYATRTLGAGATISLASSTGNYYSHIAGEFFGITHESSFWVPEGSVLVGTRFVVELYVIP